MPRRQARLASLRFDLATDSSTALIDPAKSLRARATRGSPARLSQRVGRRPLFVGGGAAAPPRGHAASRSPRLLGSLGNTQGRQISVGMAAGRAPDIPTLAIGLQVRLTRTMEARSGPQGETAPLAEYRLHVVALIVMIMSLRHSTTAEARTVAESTSVRRLRGVTGEPCSYPCVGMKRHYR